jgi:serine/threonine-protein kinase RsbW
MPPVNVAFQPRHEPPLSVPIFARAMDLHYTCRDPNVEAAVAMLASYPRQGRHLGFLIAGMAMADQSSIPSPAPSTEIRIGNDMAEIERVTDLVEGFGAGHELSNSVIVALNVSLDEVLNNIISYAYDDTARHDILVRLAIDGGGVEVIVEDDGKPFDPLAVATPRPQSDTDVGGVGLHFVRTLMDQLEYSRRAGINRLRLIKKLEYDNG